ncbi:MAG: HlyC/CorC family transporter [Lysobacteraceae bacterium]|nr:MAG: HlyC/CorC family transporter [Xanthomonadaceae bacterium]
MAELLVVLALIALNGFFAMSEMAVMTSRKLRLKQLAEDPDRPSRGARKALAMAEHPDHLLSTVQIGITLIGVCTGVFGGDAIGLQIAAWLGHAWPDAQQYARPLGIGTAVALITASSVIFGELIPKRLALTNPEAIACRVAIPLDALSTATKPVVLLLGAINRGVLRLLGIPNDARSAITEEEIHMLVSESHEQGVIDLDERNMMNRVMRLGDRTAESLMTPRTDIAWLDAAAALADNLAVMQETPFARYPVYRGGDSDVAGVLEVKTLLDELGKDVPELFRDIRPALFVSESTHALKLVEILREEQQSMALVVDEYGDIQGLVTISDVMDAVLGRLQAGEAHDEALVVEREDGSLLVDGGLHIDELRELTGERLPDSEEHDYHTAAGLVIAHFGRIPHVGEHFQLGLWRVEVVDLDGPRIDKLLLQRLPDARDSDDADG